MVNRRHPETTKILIFIEFNQILKAILQLTVQASFPASPPAQIKLVVSNKNDAPNRVAAKDV